ncbi:MAG: MmcQ/YjbR family DNA-binding protein [Bryobacteraceae bacterium]|nr:MmcQ/YjbR family DNA-binding protein [Bryobacteraceae bacterium]
MSAEWVRSICMALPHTTETVQWGDDLVFKIGQKMYAVVPLEPAANAKALLSFKCTKEGFDELIERPGIIPAPYLARAYWVSLEDAGAMTKTEMKKRLAEAYAIVVSSLTQKARAALGT